MRFFRSKAKAEWGLGVLVAEDAANVDILFEGAGRRKMAKKAATLVEVADEEVPGTHPIRSPQGWPVIERDAARAEAKRQLPTRFDSFLQEFLRHYPDGLRSAACDAGERAYKWKAVEFARSTLTAAELEPLLARGEHAEILKRTRRALAKVNLAFPQELMKFADVPQSAHAAVAERIVRLVGAGDETPQALEALAAALEPHGAAKWPVVSLIPFLLEPGRWPFVKPLAIERTQKATGINVEYEPHPNARTYALVRELYEVVARLLADRGMPPRDYIDVQTFLWLASGMATEMLKARE